MRATSCLWLARNAAWLVCGVYATVPPLWLSIHCFVLHRRARSGRVACFGLLWVVLWLIAWAVTYPLRDILLYDRAWTWLGALPLWCVSAFMYSSGMRSLRFRRIIGIEELAPQAGSGQLITTGIHARIRHPVYLGHLCTTLGWTLGSGSFACIVLVVFAILTGAIMIPLEERELRARFGTAWDDYARRVPILFPRLP